MVSKSLCKDTLLVGESLLNVSIKLLFVVSIVSLAYGISSVFFEEEKFFKKESAQGISAVLESTPVPIERKKHQDYSSFLRQIQNRDIFIAPAAEKTVSASGAEFEKLKKIIEGLRLVGIKSGAVPKVIIEDTLGKKTFYLKEGDSFCGNILIEKINKGSVMLNGKGESFELYL